MADLLGDAELFHRGKPAMRLRLPQGRKLYRLLALLVLLGGLAFWGTPLLLVQYRLGKGRSALEARDAESALGYLSQAESLSPDHAETQFLLSRTYRRLGRLDLVRKHLKRAWDLGYDVEKLKREQWLALAQAGQMSQAEPHLKQLLGTPGEDGAEICEAYVNGYFRVFRFAQAFGLLDAWQADYPEDEQPHVFRGEFAKHRGNDADAAKYYQKAISLRPSRSDVRLKLAITLNNLQRYDEAVEHFRKLLQYNANPSADLMAGWSDCLLNQGKTDEARNVLLRLLRQEPNHFAAQVSMGRLELNSGRTDSAVTWLKRAVDQKPYDSSARYAFATAIHAAGRKDEAKEHFKFFTDARKALTRAGTLMESAIERPKDIEISYQLGTILLRYDSPDDGVAWLENTLELNPNHRLARQALVEYYEKQGNKKAADLHRERLPDDKSQE